jgi:hypothetical protein
MYHDLVGSMVVVVQMLERCFAPKTAQKIVQHVPFLN